MIVTPMTTGKKSEPAGLLATLRVASSGSSRSAGLPAAPSRLDTRIGAGESGVVPPAALEVAAPTRTATGGPVGSPCATAAVSARPMPAVSSGYEVELTRPGELSMRRVRSTEIMADGGANSISASASSATFAYRSSGAFCRHRRMQTSSLAGASRRAARSGVGSRWMIIAHSSGTVVA